MSLIVNNTHKTAFREIFNLIANKKEFFPEDKEEGDETINKAGLKELFSLIDYKTNED